MFCFTSKNDLTGKRVVGKKSSLCIRSDFAFTVTASELAITVLGRHTEVIAGNSVTETISSEFNDAKSRQN